jgi:hypothetical protein
MSIDWTKRPWARKRTHNELGAARTIKSVTGWQLDAVRVINGMERRTRETAMGLVVLAPRFVANSAALVEDGAPFCAFTYKQIRELTGWDDHRVRRALE